MTEYSFFPGAASLSVAEIASLTGARLREGADPARRVTGIAPVDVAGANDLTFVDSAKFTTPLATTKAGAVLTTERFARHVHAQNGGGDPRLELRMYDAESRVQNAGPEQRRQNSAEQNRTTREHWQCYSVQQTDQSGADDVNERRENKPCCVKRQDLLVGHR